MGPKMMMIKNSSVTWPLLVLFGMLLSFHCVNGASGDSRKVI